MEAVELEDRHGVEHLLDLVDAEEVAAAVEQDAAVAEAGRVFDLATGQAPVAVKVGGGAVDGHRQHLAERLQGIEESVVVGCADHDGLASDAYLVALGGDGCVLDEVEALDLAALHGAGEPDGAGDGAGLAAHEREAVGELAHGLDGTRFEGGVAVDADTLELECALGHLELLRNRDDVGRRNLCRAGAQGAQQGDKHEDSFHILALDLF